MEKKRKSSRNLLQKIEDLEGESSTAQVAKIEGDAREEIEGQLEEECYELSEEVPQFICNYCKKRFANVSSLNNHIKKHAGRRWKCTRCDNDFVSKYAYIRHMSRAHKYRRTAEDSADEKEVYVEDDIAQMTDRAKDKTIRRLRKKVAVQKGQLAYLKAKLREKRNDDLTDIESEDLESEDSSIESDSMIYEQVDDEGIPEVAYEETVQSNE